MANLGKALRFNRLEAIDFVFQNLGAPPSTPVQGQAYLDSTTGKLKIRNATVFYDPTDRATHTGTQPATSIDATFDTRVRTSRLDQMAVPTADLDLNGRKIGNSGAPIYPSDLVRLSDLQGYTTTGVMKTAARVSPVANVNVASPGATHDGIVLNPNDRMFLGMAQTAGAERGLWQYNGPTTPLTRTSDGVTGALLSGSVVPVLEGATNADKTFQLTTDGVVTVGTTSQTWVPFASIFVPIAGSGIDVTGSTISAKVVSVFGRIGTVVAAVNDYAASLINNDSGIVGSGATVAAALVFLNTAIANTNSVFADYVPVTRTVTAGTGLTGGGNLSANRTLALDPTAVVPPARTVTAGTGLTGGGDLSANRTLAIDTAVVSRKYSETLATSATTYTITHNLGTQDVTIRCYLISTGETVLIDDASPTANTVTIGFAVAPTAGTYRVVVQG